MDQAHINDSVLLQVATLAGPKEPLQTKEEETDVISPTRTPC